MQNQDNQALIKQSQMDDDEINLMDMLLIIAKYNRFIIIFTAISAVLAVVYALLQPIIYTSKAVILPPQSNASSASVLLGNLGGLAGLVSGGGAMGMNDNSVFLGMLKSRTLADQVIARLKLQALYKTKTMTRTREALAGATKITASKDGFISIEVSNGDPKIAATIANTYVDELDILNSTVAITDAARRRLFFEKQLKLTSATLADAEASMKQTQQKTGWYQFGGLDASVGGSAGGAGGAGGETGGETGGEARGTTSVGSGGSIVGDVESVRSEISSKQVELAAKRAYMTEQNPQYIRSLEMIAALKVHLAKLVGSHTENKVDVKVPLSKLPEVGFAFIHQLRDLKYQQMLFELYSKQFEIAKMDEAKNSALIQVVDKALVPEERSGPKRSVIVITATLIAFFISILLAFFRETAERAKQNPESAQRMNLLRRYLRLGQ